jgi:hypothetical protein
LEKIDKAIENATLGKSKLTPEILAMEGMSSPWVRHLLNNIVKGNYLEIGVWHGSTFISALYKNKVNAYAIDNWSEYNYNDAKYNFQQNCAKFGISGYTFFECDAFTVDLKKIPKIDVYFYDGDHNYDETCRALVYFLPVLSDTFLFIADDYDWQGVKEGVSKGIKECNLKIIKKWELHSACSNDKETWWNGIGIFKLKKCVPLKR